MTAKPEQTAVATTKPVNPLVAEAKARTATIAALRGTLWGKECTEQVLRATAAYCRQNSIDPRVVEVLGGRIYLTAEYYDEQGAPLILDGTVKPMEPRFINNDDRINELMKSADADEAAWAKKEKFERLKLRIENNVPEDAKAAVMHQFVLKSGAIITGINWCGGAGGKKDPVGQAEPTKTALTRARRRAWRQIAKALPEYGQRVLPIEASARIALADDVTDEVEVTTKEPVKQIAAAEVVVEGRTAEDEKHELALDGREPGQEG